MKFYFKEHAVSCIFSAIKSPGGVMLVTQETPTKIRFYAEQIVKISPIFYSTGCCFLNIYKFIENTVAKVCFAAVFVKDSRIFSP